MLRTTFDNVKQIIVDQLGVSPEEVVAAAKLEEDLLADSLDRIELRMAAEDEFEITIEDDEADAILTVDQMVTLIDRKLATKAERTQTT